MLVGKMKKKKDFKWDLNSGLSALKSNSALPLEPATTHCCLDINCILFTSWTTSWVSLERVSFPVVRLILTNQVLRGLDHRMSLQTSRACSPWYQLEKAPKFSRIATASWLTNYKKKTNNGPLSFTLLFLSFVEWPIGHFSMTDKTSYSRTKVPNDGKGSKA